MAGGGAPLASELSDVLHVSTGRLHGEAGLAEAELHQQVTRGAAFLDDVLACDPKIDVALGHVRRNVGRRQEDEGVVSKPVNTGRFKYKMRKTDF